VFEKTSLFTEIVVKNYLQTLKYLEGAEHQILVYLKTRVIKGQDSANCDFGAGFSLVKRYVVWLLLTLKYSLVLAFFLYAPCEREHRKSAFN